MHMILFFSNAYDMGGLLFFLFCTKYHIHLISNKGKLRGNLLIYMN